MSRLLIARALNASGVMGATIVTAFVSLLGLLGVIVTTSPCAPNPSALPVATPPASKAANLAAMASSPAGAAGLLMAGRRPLSTPRPEPWTITTSGRSSRASFSCC